MTKIQQQFHSTLPVAKRDATVTVSDGTNAISGATVTIGSTDKTSGDDGKATFSNLEYGTYTVSVSKTGYADGTGTLTVDDTHSTLTVTLEVVDTITVTVNDGTDAIEGASVVIGETTKTTNSSGECTFTNMTYDDYEATVSADGYTSKTETLQFRSNHKSFTISLTASEGG